MQKRSQNKRTFGKRPVEDTDPDVTTLYSVSQIFIADLFNVSSAAVSKWDQCPRNADKTYNVKHVIEWYASKRGLDKAELEKQHLEKKIEQLEINIGKARERTIDKDLHEAILCSRAVSFRNYWQDTLQKNAHHFAHKSVEQLRPFLEKLVRDALRVYRDNHK